MKVAYRPTQLTGPRDKTLTKSELLKIFTPEELNKSTYSNRYGEAIRLFNRREDIAEVPALYNYDKDYISYFQQTYKNVSTYKVEKYKSKNRIVDAMFYYSTDKPQPPLPTPTPTKDN